MPSLKQLCMLLIGCSVALSLTACSGGGGGGSAPPPSTPASTTMSGQAVKGPLKKGATITAVQLGGTGSATTQIADDSGKYSLTVPWSGATQITVSGPYTDEFTGATGTDTPSLAAVANLKARTPTQIHLNLATTLVAKLYDASIQPGQDPAAVVTAQDAIVGQTISALLGATATLTNLSSIDLSQSGSSAAQLLAFQLVVLAAIPPGSSVNQVIPQFVQNIHSNRLLADPVPGINGTTFPNLQTAINELKGGQTLTLKQTGTPTPISQVMANLTSTAGVKDTIADLVIQISGNQVATLTISPATTLVAPGQAKTINVNAKNIKGQNLQKIPVLWFSSDPTIASIDTSGRLTGLSPGSITVSASNGTITSNTINVTVVTGALTSIEAGAADSTTIQIGATEQFTASAKDGAANTLSGVDFTWVSSDQTVATIDSTGLATGLKVGTTTITASNGAVTSPGVTLTVVPVPPLPPTFSFFAPPGGLAGTLVTIVGTNFAPTPADNIVQFNGGVATVNTVSANKMVVTVPPGAKNGPILVTTPGGTIASAASFNASVTNPGQPSTSAGLTVDSRPEGIAITRDGTRVYAVNALDKTLSVINTANNKLVATIALPSVSSIFGSVATSLDGNTVYVSLSTSLGIINVSQSTPTVQVLQCCAAPAQLALSPDGARLYIADGSSELVVVDTATNTVIQTYDLPGGAGGFGIAAHPDGKRVYVTNQNTDTLFVVDTTQNTVTPIAITVQTGTAAPRGIAIRPDGQVAYVSLFTANAVAVVDMASSTVSTILPLPAHQAGTAGAKAPNGIAASPDGKLVYAANTCKVISASCPALIDVGVISVLDITNSPPTVSDISVLNSNATTAVVFTPDGSHAYITAERPDNNDRVFRLP